MFEGLQTRTEVVTVFLAILHLISRGRIKAESEGNNIILINSGDEDEI